MSLKLIQQERFILDAFTIIAINLPPAYVIEIICLEKYMYNVQNLCKLKFLTFQSSTSENLRKALKIQYLTQYTRFFKTYRCTYNVNGGISRMKPCLVPLERALLLTVFGQVKSVLSLKTVNKQLDVPNFVLRLACVA